jgi:hypothetical protein
MMWKMVAVHVLVDLLSVAHAAEPAGGQKFPVIDTYGHLGNSLNFAQVLSHLRAPKKVPEHNKRLWQFLFLREGIEIEDGRRPAKTATAERSHTCHTH